MNLAITAAGSTPEEANGLRRAMATFRNVGTIDNFRDKMVGGMVARGYKQDFAERCFKQIEGFGSYGFPESHAQSFARLVYVSSWIKHYHPAVFACGILNSQPMGFYAPAQLVRDARDHGRPARRHGRRTRRAAALLQGRPVAIPAGARHGFGAAEASRISFFAFFSVSCHFSSRE